MRECGSEPELWTLISQLIPFVISVAWLALKHDEPVRSWLSRRYGIKRATAEVLGQAGEGQ
jgi:hypothetical protein